MTTSRQTVNFGETFSVSVNNVREQEFKIVNFSGYRFDSVSCKITNTTSYPPPTIYVADESSGIIKLIFDSRTPINTALQLLILPVIAQKTVIENVTKNQIVSDETLDAITQAPGKVGSALWRYLKTVFMGFLLGSILLYTVKDTRTGRWLFDFWKTFNAAQIIELGENFDLRIATNKHEVYKTHTFTALNADYKEEFGNDRDLTQLYNFVGNRDIDGRDIGFFVMADLVRDQNGLPVLADKDDAEEHCDRAGGELLPRSELQIYLAQQYLGVENFLWPIQRRAATREWAADIYSWMFGDSWLYLKEKGVNPTEKKIVSGFVVADEDIKAAFRCGFMESFYTAAN